MKTPQQPLPPQGVPDEVREQLSLQDLIDIADRLVEQKRYDEAVALFETAQRLYPDSVAVRLNLARVRDLKRHEDELEYQRLQDKIQKQKAEADILTGHFLSLARVYLQRNQLLKVLELLELARQINPHIAEIHRIAAQVYYDQMDYGRALASLEEARKHDPFNAEIPHLQSRIEIEQKRFDRALTHIIDAYLLSGSEQSRYRELYSEQMRTLMNTLKLNSKDIEKIMHERKDYYNQFVEQLILKKGQVTFDLGPSSDMDIMLLHLPRLEQARQGVLNLAMILRRFAPFSVMTDEQVLGIAKRSQMLNLPAEEVVFREDQTLTYLYIVVDGGLRIQKSTPFGNLLLASMGEGQILGEMDYIDRLQASADAITKQNTQLVAIDRNGLAELMVQDKFLGIQLYWHFWKLLAERIRLANEQAQTFFKRMLENPNEIISRKDSKTVAGELTHIDFDKKMAVLHEKGLTSSEIKLLASFSQEEKFSKDQVIFREGDKGDRLFIVVDGQVRISKYIPGVGEEALAILDRGEFFGEMALVDGSPRSADAIAHSAVVTVLSVNQRILSDILSRNPESALRFLKILCRMMSHRLREINLKIYQWHMMAGMPITE